MSAPTLESTVRLPQPDGTLSAYRLPEPTDWPVPQQPLTARKAYAAAHVVPVMTADNTPGAPAVLDWGTTLELRRRIWGLGLGVADAMDTAQRGMGLDWAATAELIERSSAAAAAELGRGNPALAGLGVRDLIACGAGTDQLTPGANLAQVRRAYAEQLEVVEAAGAKVVLMCSRALAATARDWSDYRDTYAELLRRADQPVILHWLGTMFDPALAGYWGSADTPTATRNFLSLIEEHADKVDGVKVSLLDARHEVALRAALPAGVRLYTGDDFNYPELIDGDGDQHSDALLGIFAAIAPAASAALQRYDASDPQQGREILDSTRELGRHIFAAPTFHYKTGIAFLAWLNGDQPGFQMVGGMQSARSLVHLGQTLRLAGEAGLLRRPDLAAERFAALSSIGGVR
ncbi:uncharacterized protein DUF993 [Propionibacteriaceae bacterium ES.041]|uniref:dihydrodipicolinate synthase family protein n=1 Tax=Enemella evansiae TaxID=2016499 RepID=UPI000C013003|nr:dihydrodipicolinate synthase family protein [Enemella evansiae]PFG66044.1 uncharacterized protein DUF993 [Propionibacteriaceae bacterium ES.041]